MTTFCLVNPQGAIDRQTGNIDPTVGTKAGWKWLPVESAPQPATSALETASSVYVVGASKVTQQWSVTRLPLDAQKAAVKAEAQRRIIALTGKATLQDCMIKQFNALMRAGQLTDKRVSGEALLAEEETEAILLRGLADKVAAIRAASNAVEALATIPLDYAADKHWPAV